MVEGQGFKFERHQVKTEDGYILEMHRVFKDKSSQKPAIFIQHGILSNSEAFVLHKEKSAAFKFANEGFDVWLGNNKGSLYSRKHETLNPDKKEDEK